MGFVYDLTIDPNADNNTHAMALDMIGHNKSVLEVGCATGYFTKVLHERGCKVVGIEIDPEAAQAAETWAERVVVGDVENKTTWESIDDEYFDVITFGDVLEHLRDPLTVLRMALGKLKPNGFVVTSLPNFAHGDVRLALLHGSFQYRDTGLLDRTHLRFFTLQTIRELLNEAGLTIVDTRRVRLPMFQTELGLRQEDYPDAVVDEVRQDSEYDTYQFVMKSVMDNGSQALGEATRRLEEASDQVQQLEARNRFLEDKLIGYNEMKQEYDRISGEMQTFVEHIDDLTRQVYLLHEQLRTAEERREQSEATVESLNESLAESTTAAEDAERRYREIFESRSFRVTAPLRWLQAKFGSR